MADLKLDLERLTELKNDLEAVVKEFKNADDFSDDVAEATGQDDLASQVRSFASKWNDKRKKMLAEVENLQAQIKAISDGFTQVDEGLAKALEDNGKTPSGHGRTRAS